jgi:hypothetical protein
MEGGFVMGKSSDPHATTVVSLAEGNAFRTYAARARLAFLALTTSGAVLGAIVLAQRFDPAWGFLLGGVAGFLVGLVVGCVIAVWPLLRVLWHWATEITLVLTGAIVWSVLTAWSSAWVPLTLYTAVATVLTAVPRLRRRAWALVWCAIVRHRLRLSFAAFIRSRNRLHGRGGSPLILLARPTPAGERVWVWLRTGLDMAELESNVDRLAVSCWASEVQVTRTSPRHAALVRVDITRRNPMTMMVDAPFATRVPDVAAPLSAVADPSGGLEIDDVPADLVNLGGLLPRPRGGSR